MVARSLIKVITSAFIFASCSDHRPELAQAKADFSRLYPSAEIVVVRISEDEVIARTFAITYHRPGESQTKTLEVQYVKDNQGVYKLAQHLRRSCHEKTI